MIETAHSLIDTRRSQMFPTLKPAEIERLRRFGELRSYRAGDFLATTGEVGPGRILFLQFWFIRPLR